MNTPNPHDRDPLAAVLRDLLEVFDRHLRRDTPWRTREARPSRERCCPVLVAGLAYALAGHRLRRLLHDLLGAVYGLAGHVHDFLLLSRELIAMFTGIRPLGFDPPSLQLAHA